MSRTRSAVSVSLFYAALFGAVGVQLPFWPIWLADRGLDAAQIGIALATPYLGRAIFSPLMGWVVDHLGQRQRPLLIIALLTTLLWTCFALVHSFGMILILGFFASGLWACMMPLGDIVALSAAAHWAFNYAHARLWGSISFIVATMGAGIVLAWIQPPTLVWLIAGVLALTALSAALLPDLRPPAHERGSGTFKELLSLPAFRWFLLCTALNQASHTALYGFGTLHWQQAGISSTAIGMLWSTATIAEIVLFLFAGPVSRAVRPEILLLVGIAGGIVRWTALGLTTNFYWLLLFQALHALTFGSAHLGAMYFLQKAIPARSAARAQGLYSSLAAGIMPGLMLPLTGWIYEHYDGAVFFLMTLTTLAASAAAVMLLRCRDRQTVLG